VVYHLFTATSRGQPNPSTPASNLQDAAMHIARGFLFPVKEASYYVPVLRPKGISSVAVHVTR
jgi:hypothetical protein